MKASQRSGPTGPTGAASQGYTRLMQGGFAFWTRPGMADGGGVRWKGDGTAGEVRAWDGAGAQTPAPRPLVFLHGVGWGLVRLRLHWMCVRCSF